MKGSFPLCSLSVCIHQAPAVRPADSIKSLKQSESRGLHEYLIWLNESQGESARIETGAHNQWHRLPGLVWLTGFFVFINDGELVQQGRGLLGEFFKHLGNTRTKKLAIWKQKYILKSLTAWDRRIRLRFCIVNLHTISCKTEIWRKSIRLKKKKTRNPFQSTKTGQQHQAQCRRSYCVFKK